MLVVIENMYLILCKIAGTRDFVSEEVFSKCFILFFSMMVNNIALDKYMVYVDKSIRNGLEIKYIDFRTEVVFGKEEQVVEWQGVVVGDRLNL